MGNPYITAEMLNMQLSDYKTDDAKKFVTVFAICIGLNILCCIGCCSCTKLACYQDKDTIVYHVPVGSRVHDEYSGNINS